MVIIGIIITMSFPLVRRISDYLNIKKYDTYSDAVKNSAKQYVQSNKKDLFGDQENACAYITYDELNDKGLIKDISLSDTSCNSDKTFVVVNKRRNNYKYRVQLGCGTKKNNKLTNEEINILYPKNEIKKDNLCTIAPIKPVIENPTNGGWTNTPFKVRATSSCSSGIGSWYYSFDNKNFTKDISSEGKDEFVTADFLEEQDKTLYVKACNIYASGYNDDINCSLASSTNIKIDKQQPSATINFHGNNGWVRENKICAYGDEFGEAPSISITKKDNGKSGIKRTEFSCTSSNPNVATAIYEKEKCRIEISTGKTKKDGYDYYDQSKAKVTCNMRVQDEAGNVKEVSENKDFGNGWVYIGAWKCDSDNKYGGNWYYIDNYKPVKGWLYTYWYATDNDLWYYMDKKSGKMYWGWHTIDGYKYYFADKRDRNLSCIKIKYDPKDLQNYNYADGAMVRNDTLYEIENKDNEWTFDDKGHCVSGKDC